MRILVIGKNGQVGQSIQNLVNKTSNSNLSDYGFVFVGRDELNLSKASNIQAYFEKNTPNFRMEIYEGTEHGFAFPDRQSMNIQKVFRDNAVNRAVELGWTPVETDAKWDPKQQSANIAALTAQSDIELSLIHI